MSPRSLQYSQNSIQSTHEISAFTTSTSKVRQIQRWASLASQTTGEVCPASLSTFLMNYPRSVDNHFRRLERGRLSGGVSGIRNLLMVGGPIFSQLQHGFRERRCFLCPFGERSRAPFRCFGVAPSRTLFPMVGIEGSSSRNLTQ